MPRVAREAVQGRVGVNSQPHVGQVRASDGNGTSTAHALDDRCVGGTHRFGEGDHGVGRRGTSEIDVLFHGAGNPVQRSECRAGSNIGVGPIGRHTGLVVEATDDGVQSWVDFVDSSQVGFDHFATRDVPTGDRLGELSCPLAPQFISHVRPRDALGSNALWSLDQSGGYSLVVNRWIVGARPRTLPAAVVPVALGAAVAVGEGGASWTRVPLAGVVALALQVGVNYANDYSDGVRGVDDDRVGPVRLVGSGLASAPAVKAAAIASFAVAALCGLFLAASTSWWLLVVGAASILAGWFYTGGPRPYGYAGFGEVFVFVFFGLVATVGTTYVVLERLPYETWLLGTATGALSCALLVTNNLRDIPTDRVASKLTLAVRLGDERTRTFYVALVFVSMAALVVAGFERPEIFVGVAAAVFAWRPIAVVRSGATGRHLIAVLEATGRLQLVMGALVVSALIVLG